MKNRKRLITKSMVHERVCIIIETLEASYDLTVIAGNLHKKKLELAFQLLKKLQANKVPPALIFAQLNNHFGSIQVTEKVDPKIIKDVSLQISNPTNLN